MMRIVTIIFIVISAIGLLLSAHDHGKPRDNENFWIRFISTVISWTLLLWSWGWVLP